MFDKKLFTRRNAAFVLLFLALVVLADQFSIFNMYTANLQTGALEPMKRNFTGIQFFAPIAGGLMQSTIGFVVVLAAQLVSILLKNAPLDIATIFRLFTLAIGAYYFGKAKDSRLVAIAPLIAIPVFMLTVDISAWYYAVIWMIPALCVLPQLKNIVFIRALGATFAAHAFGNIWYTIFMGVQPAMFWTALFPVTIAERIVMAAGITVSYFAVNAVLTKYFSDAPILTIEKKYALF